MLIQFWLSSDYFKKVFFLDFCLQTPTVPTIVRKGRIPSLFSLTLPPGHKQWDSYLHLYIFVYQDFFSRTLRISRTAGKVMGRYLFLFTTSTSSQIFRHLFATLRLRLLPGILNCIICNYQTTTWWGLPTLGIWIWMIINWTLISILLDNLLLVFIAVILYKQLLNL